MFKMTTDVALSVDVPYSKAFYPIIFELQYATVQTQCAESLVI